jgi:hypothetical protein
MSVTVPLANTPRCPLEEREITRGGGCITSRRPSAPVPRTADERIQGLNNAHCPGCLSKEFVQFALYCTSVNLCTNGDGNFSFYG